MTLFEFMVPAFALGLAVVGAVALHYEGKRVDRKLNDRKHRQHPAE